MKLLLIGSNVDARPFAEAFRDVAEFDLAVEASLASDGLRSRRGVDLVVLSLALPDAPGPAALERLRTALPVPPVVAVGDGDPPETIHEVFRLGAQAYVDRAELEPRLLRRVLLNTLARTRSTGAVDGGAPHAARLQRELDESRRLLASVQPSAVAPTFGVPPLRDYFPEKFSAFVGAYTQAIDAAIVNGIHKHAGRRAAPAVLAMSDELGFLRAGARDVIDIHTTAVRARAQGSVEGETPVFLEEARVALVELMGNLLGFYRRYALPAVRESRTGKD